MTSEKSIHNIFAKEILDIRKDIGSIMKILMKEHPEEAGNLHRLLERLEPMRKYHANKYIEKISN